MYSQLKGKCLFIKLEIKLMFSSAGMSTGKSKETLSHDVPDSGRWKYFVCISILDNYLVTKNNIKFKDLYAIINQLYVS